jgi:glycine dehydrogenase subunit 2
MARDRRPFPTIRERGEPGRRAAAPPRTDLEAPSPAELLAGVPQRRTALELPEVSEIELVRHYNGLSLRNYGVDTGFYPLGSCTMKYNPKVDEEAARLFEGLHPLQDDTGAQGAIRLYWETQEALAQLTGMDAYSLQPAAGAHGELTGMLMIRAFHRANGEDSQRREVIVPDGAHGTNPATAAMAGYKVVTISSAADGEVDLEAFSAVLGPHTAAVMLTNPNTLGLFERNILEIARRAHRAGAQLYYDGANLNAIVGRFRPGDMGFDVMHLNLHKTFAVPHGGGGAGVGPVGCQRHLEPFLPAPVAVREDDDYRWDADRPRSIGRVRSFHGNALNVVRAYTYIKALGLDGLRDVAAKAVLNANYLRKLVGRTYQIPYDRVCMHEFIASPAPLGKEVKTLDIAKAIIDEGFHPPTIYFPLLVPEAMMIEPTETESLETLEAFAAALERIAHAARSDPQRLKGAPYSTPVGRLDEARAVRKPVLTWAAGERADDERGEPRSPQPV